MHKRDIIASLLVLFSLCGAQAVLGQSKDNRPNIIFILADDLGWADVGYNGSAYYETPNIDKMAAQSVVFEQGYANAPNCAPTRASFITGQYTSRHGVITVHHSNKGDRKAQKLIPPKNIETLDTATVSIAEALKKKGYKTLHIGKWHLGEHENFGPEAHGFDGNIGGWAKGSPKSYFSPYKNPMLKDGPEGEQLTDRLTQEALNYMKSQAGSDAPYFLYLPYYGVHTPLQAKEELVEKFKGKASANGQKNPTYTAMVATLDENIGRMKAFLDQQQGERETILVFFSDNGGSWNATSNHPLKGAKGTMYEGGIREPAFVYAPKRYKARKITTPVITTDMYPTFLDWAGGFDPKAYRFLDGESLLPIIEKGEARQQPIYWYAPVYLPARKLAQGKYGFRTTPASAIRVGDYKLIWFYEEDKAELYNINADISEANNLADKQPKLYKKMLGKLKQWHKKTGAFIPHEANPQYSEKDAGKYEVIRFQ